MGNSDVLDIVINLQDKASAGMETVAGAADKLQQDLSDVGDKANGSTGGVDSLKSALDAMQASMDQVAQSTDRAADAVSGFDGGNEKVQATADTFGNLERTMLGVNDLMGVAAEKFGLPLGPMESMIPALADVGGGMEALIAGGTGLIQTFVPMVTGMVPVIASTWAHVTALGAQAAAMIAANAPILIIIATLALLVAGVYLVVQNWDVITEKIPLLGAAFDAVKAVIDIFLGWITGTFLPGMEAMAQGAMDKVQSIIDFFVNNWDKIRGIVEPAMDGLKIIIETVLNLIEIYISTWWGVIQGLFSTAIAILSGDWQGAWDGMKQTFEAVWNGLEATVRTVLTAISGLGSVALSAATNIGDGIKNGIVSGIKGILSSVGEISGALTDALRSAVNTSLAWLSNNVRIDIPGFDPPGPGSIPGFSWSFPYMQFAKGGIVTKPMFGLIGEAGQSEAVVPLDKLEEFVNRKPSGGGVQVNIYGKVQARNSGEARKRGQQIGSAINSTLRSRGVA